MASVFPVFYCGNLGYYKALLSCDEIQFEAKEHFVKQTPRSRMEILGPNGVQKLTIPTVKTGQRRPMEEVEISYAENWQKDHWKSLEAAYRRSPYFEFFEDRFRSFYQGKEPSLLKFNLDLQQVILSILKASISFSFTSNYVKELPNDFRWSRFDENGFNKYTQVFSDRYDFKTNLSILDAIFCIGPRAKSLLVGDE